MSHPPNVDSKPTKTNNIEPANNDVEKAEFCESCGRKYENITTSSNKKSVTTSAGICVAVVATIILATATIFYGFYNESKPKYEYDGLPEYL